MADESTGRIVTGTCRDCPHWDHLEAPPHVVAEMPDLASGRAGVCRHKSPQHIQALDPATVPPTLISGIRPGMWPITQGSDWCGDNPLRQAHALLELEELRKQVEESAREVKRQARKAYNESRRIKEGPKP